MCEAAGAEGLTIVVEHDGTLHDMVQVLQACFIF